MSTDISHESGVSESSEDADKSVNAVDVRLTVRQRQILKLMKQGLVNKEIARELDISLGTVKQHIVALFKKLNVTNRTMAVACSDPLLDETDSSAEQKPVPAKKLDAIHARRPSVTLSFRLETENIQDYRTFHRVLSAASFDCNAHFISRSHGDGDLVFGIHRSSEHDLRIALIQAGIIFDQLRTELGDGLALYGGMSAGYISISQNRYGGWSGDAIARSVIDQARSLLEKTEKNSLSFDSDAQSIMNAYDTGIDGQPVNTLAFSDIDQLMLWDMGFDSELTGREKEKSIIFQLINPDSPHRICLLEGEGGMGKSRLCREAGRYALQTGIALSFYKMLPGAVWDSMHCRLVGTGMECMFETIRAASENGQPHLVIMDDVHLLSAARREQLNQLLEEVLPGTCFLLSGRQSSKDVLQEHSGLKNIHLSRMTESEAMELIEHLVPGYQNTQPVIEKSRCVPLFIREIVREQPDVISMALVLTVAARLDRMRVDWKLLYALALGQSSVDELPGVLNDSRALAGQSLQRAISLGVLYEEGGYISYRSPLVKEVVAFLFSDQLKPE